MQNADSESRVGTERDERRWRFGSILAEIDFFGIFKGLGFYSDEFGSSPVIIPLDRLLFCHVDSEKESRSKTILFKNKKGRNNNLTIISVSFYFVLYIFIFKIFKIGFLFSFLNVKI